MKRANDEICDLGQRDGDFWPRLANWFFPIFLWDGMLPMGVLTLGFAVKLFLPLAIQPLIIFAPIVCLFVRYRIASIQIENVCGGKKLIHRQVLIRIAIIIALVFELLSLALQFSGQNGFRGPILPEEKHDLLLSVIWSYFLYLIVIMLALRPCRKIEQSMAD